MHRFRHPGGADVAEIDLNEGLIYATHLHPRCPAFPGDIVSFVAMPETGIHAAWDGIASRMLIGATKVIQ